MELLIYDDFDKMTSKLYLRVQQGNNIAMIGYDGKTMIEEQLPEDPATVKKFQPLLEVPLHMKGELLQAFVDFGKKINLPSPKKDFLEGKLESTEKHLDEMSVITHKLLNFFTIKK